MLRHAYYSFLSFLLLLISASSLPVMGSPLSADQALSMAMASSAMRAPAESHFRLPLVLTLHDSISQQPAVYVFGCPTEPGFVIAAADDAVTEVLLGYSDSSCFDPQNIPLPMRDLLSRYAFAVGRCAAAQANMAETGMYNPISPLISSKWSQGDPFNALCPQIDGAPAPAGCVATAVAQVMNSYQWPPFGTGSVEYEFSADSSAGDVHFAVSSDFSSHFYDWANMQDVYSSASTPEECQAVGLLMSDCGYAAQTEYSHAGSGANVLMAGTGMVDNFSYDPAMRYLRREWCTHRQWSDIIYAELSEGRPVIYSGFGAIDGHTFVVDGCDADGYFHVNWGWAGVADGYYTLADVSPVEPSGDSLFQSYNSGQNMIVGIRPYADGNPPGNMAIVDALGTNKSSYKSVEDYVNFNGGFYSFALTDLEYKIGFMADVDPPVYVPSHTIHLSAGWGVNQASVSCRYFPEGEYDVYPVYKVGDGEWHHMLHNLALTSGRLHFVNDGSTITVSAVPTSDFVAGNITSTSLTSIVAVDGGEERLYPTHTYIAEFEVVADGACFNELRAVLLDSQMQLAAVGAPLLVDITEAEPISISLPISLPQDIAPGEYLIGVAASVDGDLLPLSGATAVNVDAESIYIDNTEADIIIGESLQLNAVAHTDAYPLKWESSDVSVASVDEGGMVTAVGLGEAVVTASCCCAEASCIVRVLPVMASEISLTPSSVSLEVGSSVKLEVTVLPENTTDKSVEWSVSDPSLVQVDSDGVVTALAEGYAEVCASCGEVSAVCAISAFSGIESALRDRVSVHLEDATLIVSAPGDTLISVYALDGTLCYQGFDSRISLGHDGAYLVIVADKVFKVAVK